MHLAFLLYIYTNTHIYVYIKASKSKVMQAMFALFIIITKVGHSGTIIS